jgi:hypothetical protein
MALITPDFSEVTESQPIQPGTYPARIIADEVGNSKAGNPMVKWTLSLFGDPAWNNRQIFHRTPTTGKGAFRLQEIYKAAMNEPLAKGMNFDTAQLIGREVTVTLQQGTDQDGNPSKYPEVKAITAYKQ